ncbi:AAA family ATPase [Methylibium sp.]|uniref:AAA family ATPase n=1 Tax=Methylibium sp. TaxID=2067992 RepID=UPI0017CA0C6A|nr:AAA family ATPase [Methylibium sp.]MBA3589722.1 AAA family ATPase [Methylibium sp.]
MDRIFLRTALAQQMAQQLLHPGVLDEGLRSGLFISGVRRTGKTTFLQADLVPALEAAGALVIYVDLWSNTQANPATLVHAAIRRALQEVQTPTGAIAERLKKLRNAEIAVAGFKFGFKVESVGTEGGATLAEAFTQVVDQAHGDIVLIVDEIQHAITSDEGNKMLLALKAARDAINPRPGTPGHFIFVGTGSHRALVSELTARRNQAFAGATSIAYPVLDADYVAHLLERLRIEGLATQPSLEVATQAFRTLGARPEEMLRALRELRSLLPPGGDPNDFLPVIAGTLRSTAADVEIMKVEQLGALATAVFERVAGIDGDAKGLFSADSLAGYAQVLGRDVRADEVQAVLNELMVANVVMRRGHGLYGLTDPFVQEIWRERNALMLPPGEVR